MKNIKITSSHLFFIALVCPINIIAIKPAGVAMMEKIEDVAYKNMPIFSKASENFGRNLGLGTAIYLSEKAAVAGEAIVAVAAKFAATVKTGTTFVIAAPATPYIVVGVGVVGGGYVVYRVYRSYHPTTGEQIIRVEEERRLQAAKAELNQATAEKDRAKIEMYKSKADRVVAKKEMMAKMASQMVPATA